MRAQTENKRTAAWRFIVAILIFWLSTIFIGLIVNLIMSLLNIITPRFYQKGQIEINITADLFAVAISCNLADNVLEEKHRVFCAVNCILLALLNAFAIYAALITPKEYRDPYYGSVAFLIAYVIAIIWFFNNRPKNNDKRGNQIRKRNATTASEGKESSTRETPVALQTVETDTSLPERTNSSLKILFCDNCGAKLEPDSVYCSYCGTKIKDT